MRLEFGLWNRIRGCHHESDKENDDGNELLRLCAHVLIGADAKFRPGIISRRESTNSKLFPGFRP
jgi:hypothetical protein